MNEETQIIEKDEPTKVKSDESHFFSVSVRSIIALIIVGTICYMSMRALEVKEPLYTLGALVTGFFFGQASKPKSQQ